MSWKLDKNKPICQQIKQQVVMMIVRGEYEPGGRLPSVRDLAVDAGVNPNTVQKAFEQMEADGLIYTMRGQGRYVVDDISDVRQKSDEIVNKKISDFFKEMELIGINNDEVKDMVRKWHNE